MPQAHKISNQNKKLHNRYQFIRNLSSVEYIIIHQQSHMQYCTLSCIEIKGHLNYEDMCLFTKDQCVQDTVQFVQAYYCLLHGSFFILAFVGIPIFLLLFKTLNVIAQDFLSPCVEEFIQEFHISPTLAGVTFLAFANGAPDVMTAIIAGSSQSSSTALIPFGSIFGACLFCMAFVLAEVIFCQESHKLKLRMREILLPLAFYIIGVLFIILITLIWGKMNIYSAAVLLVLYLIYIVVMVKTQRKKKTKKNKLLIDDIDKSILSSTDIQTKPTKEESYESVSEISQQLIVQEKQEKQEGFINKINETIENVQKSALQFLIPFYKIEQWNPLRAVISLTVSPFIIAFAQQFPQSLTSFVGPIPVFLLISLPALLLLSYTIYCIVRKQEPYFIKVFTIYSFIVSICGLTVVCSVLINLVELVQILTGMNSVFLGLTVFAWANSIGDYLTITHFARNGNPSTAIAGIFSGQLFNFLLGFGISLCIQSWGKEYYDFKIFDFQGTTYDKISDSIVMIVIFASLIYFIITFGITIIKKGVLMRGEAIFARWYYIVFMIITLLLAVSTDFFGAIQCKI